MYYIPTNFDTFEWNLPKSTDIQNQNKNLKMNKINIESENGQQARSKTKVKISNEIKTKITYINKARKIERETYTM